MLTQQQHMHPLVAELSRTALLAGHTPLQHCGDAMRHMAVAEAEAPKHIADLEALVADLRQRNTELAKFAGIRAEWWHNPSAGTWTLKVEVSEEAMAQAYSAEVVVREVLFETSRKVLSVVKGEATWGTV